MDIKCEICGENAVAEVTDAIMGLPVDGWRAWVDHGHHSFCNEHLRSAVFIPEPPSEQTIKDQEAFNEWCNSSLLTAVKLADDAIKSARNAVNCISGIANEMRHASERRRPTT